MEPVSDRGNPERSAASPFEIIEIGAVKLDKNFRTCPIRFREIVQPVVYRTLHFKTRKSSSTADRSSKGPRIFLKSSQTFLAGAETIQVSVPGALQI